MVIPSAVLVRRPSPSGCIPQLGPVVQAAAVRFQDQAGYNATVLVGRAHRPSGRAWPPPSLPGSPRRVLTGLGSVGGALVLAWLALYWRRLPLLRRGYEPGAGLARPIRRFQSGVVNDYVTWIVVGLACLGGILAVAIR